MHVYGYEQIDFQKQALIINKRFVIVMYNNFVINSMYTSIE